MIEEVEVVEEKKNLGLRIQDLQEEKDKLLIETADMLHLSIFAAEILLKKHCRFNFLFSLIKLKIIIITKIIFSLVKTKFAQFLD